MAGRKLALLAASLAGGAVLSWTVVETLREGGIEPRSTVDAEAGSPIARLVARMGPPDHTTTATDGAVGWRAWARAAAALEDGGALAGGTSDGVGNRRGHDFWDAWARRLDRARGAAWTAMREPDSLATPRHREPVVRGRQPYRLPTTGQRTILASGHRLGRPDIRLPRNAQVSIARARRALGPVRVEVCVNRSGKPVEARVTDGTGVEAVDRYIARQMLDGRYRPLRQDGRPVAFCERTTVVLGS